MTIKNDIKKLHRNCLAEKIGDNILKYRCKRFNLTQEELARIAGFQTSAISHFEMGRRVPTIQNLIRLAEALQVTVDELIF